MWKTLRTLLVPLVCASALAPAPARAADDDELTWNGALATRGLLTTPSDHALLSTADQPVLGALVEANLQARGRWFERSLSLVSDASLFVAGGSVYADLDEDGYLVAVDDHDVRVSAARPGATARSRRCRRRA